MDLPEEVRSRVDFVPVKVMDEVLVAALAEMPGPSMSEGVRNVLSGGAEPGAIS